jgi:CRP-like cAMP-binding protein
MSPSRLELLQRMPIFGAIDDGALEFLIGRAGTVRVARGGYFFRENDQAESMFVLESGRVEVVRGWRGRELIVQQLGAGDCFGEMALLDLFPRSGSVRALEDCSAIVIAAADLHGLYEHDVVSFALIQMNLAREMSRRLRNTDEQLFRMWVGETPTATAEDTIYPRPRAA